MCARHLAIFLGTMLFGLLTCGMAEAKTSLQFATPHFIGSERRWIVARVGYRDHAVCMPSPTRSRTARAIARFSSCRITDPRLHSRIRGRTDVSTRPTLPCYSRRFFLRSWGRPQMCHKKLVRFDEDLSEMEVLTRGGGAWVSNPGQAATNHGSRPMSRQSRRHQAGNQILGRCVLAHDRVVNRASPWWRPMRSEIIRCIHQYVWLGLM